TRVVQNGGVLSPNAALAREGVYVKKWDFGTIQCNNNAPTPIIVDADFFIDLFDVQQVVLESH
ncbi:10650_t:CDS:2, partial [Diversispora eburnea]